MTTIRTPRTMYHQDVDVPISLLARDAVTPRTVNVTAAPKAKTIESKNARFVLL